MPETGDAKSNLSSTILLNCTLNLEVGVVDTESGVQPGWSITNPQGRGFRWVLSCTPLPLFNRFVMLKLDPAVSEESVVARYLQDLRQPPSSLTC